ncbi:MAG: glycosyltransferase family 4 protein, partial [Acidobacteria bacterium]|nr:glycosyltransferase family 4 protein [Acidobacteriota bacterium]
VSVVCNCPAEAHIQKVLYRPLDSVQRIEADVLVLHTTGDQLDLRRVLELDIAAGRRIVLVGGVDAPKGLAEVAMDRLYPCSNFIANIATREWGVKPEQIFVSHHGVIRRNFEDGWFGRRPRDAFRIAYATHPSKGLEAARKVLALLRAEDPRFTLHVFGGNALWGQAAKDEAEGQGVVYYGLMGQRELARQLRQCGSALYLQGRLEPFGVAIVEALAAGCITIASDVGAHAEIVTDGVTGLLLRGDHESEAVQREAATLLASLARNPGFGDVMRRQAQAAPLDWDTVAAAWEQEWSGEAQSLPDSRRCVRCARNWALFADGYHCQACGFYSRSGIG